MIAGQGFDLHPLAAQDITDIWEFIAADDPLAARRVPFADSGSGWDEPVNHPG